MQVFLFNSQLEPRAFGLTGDSKGANLPGPLAPWRPLGIRAMSACGDICGTDRAASVLTKISKIGYYVALTAPGPDTRREG
jgi:hypothetical protein